MKRSAILLLLPLISFSVDHAAAQQQHDHQHMHAQMQGALPSEPGQSAFSAIQEIVAILTADPATDWSKVDIEALRQHLIDMDNVTLRANVKAEQVDGGMRFIVSGSGDTAASIRRMVTGHALTMSGINGWTYDVTDAPDGAVVLVKAQPSELPRLKALGFIGILTLGMHHQQHHLAIARGQSPHG